MEGRLRDFCNQQDVRLSDKRILNPLSKSGSFLKDLPKSVFPELLKKIKMVENRTRRVTIRFTPDEYKLIEKRFQESMFRKISEYSRALMLQKPVRVIYRDKSMDDVLEELILIRKELNYIGNNFNQTVHKLNSVMGMPDSELWQAALILLRGQLEPAIREIKEKMDNYSEIWSRFTDEPNRTIGEDI